MDQVSVVDTLLEDIVVERVEVQVAAYNRKVDNVEDRIDLEVVVVACLGDHIWALGGWAEADLICLHLMILQNHSHHLETE